MITSHGLHPFLPNGQSQRRVQKADPVKFLPNPRTKIAESPIVNAVILDFAIVVQMLPPKPGHLGRVLQWYQYICTLRQKTAGICKQSSPCQGRSQKKTYNWGNVHEKLVTEAIGPWLRSLPGYLASVFMMTITTQTKELTESSASVGLLLATIPHLWDAYVADSLKGSAREKEKLW